MNAVVSVQLRGKFTVGGGGDVTFEKADEGIDFAPATVQLPGGERVPFLFSMKELSAKGTLDGFSGDFTVPSYRGSSFLDPKVRSTELCILLARKRSRCVVMLEIWSPSTPMFCVDRRCTS